jgi:ribosome modulation factor
MPLDQTQSSASNDSAAEWMRLYRTQRRKCDEEQGVLRNIVKRAKTDGMNTKAMIAAIAATKLDPEVVAADLRDEIRYMTIVRIPIHQAELFDGWDETVTQKTTQQDDLWDAEDAGYRAGRHGAAVEECKYLPGTELHVHWLEHWHKGQAAIARELGQDVKQADAAKARPKREQPNLGILNPKRKAAAKSPRGGRRSATPASASGASSQATH